MNESWPLSHEGHRRLERHREVRPCHRTYIALVSGNELSQLAPSVLSGIGSDMMELVNAIGHVIEWLNALVYPPLNGTKSSMGQTGRYHRSQELLNCLLVIFARPLYSDSGGIAQVSILLIIQSAEPLFDSDRCNKYAAPMNVQHDMMALNILFVKIVEGITSTPATSGMREGSCQRYFRLGGYRRLPSCCAFA